MIEELKKVFSRSVIPGRYIYLSGKFTCKEAQRKLGHLVSIKSYSGIYHHLPVVSRNEHNRMTDEGISFGIRDLREAQGVVQLSR